MILPQGVARWSLLFLICAWTYGLILLWHPPLPAAAVFAFVGCTFGIKTVANYSEEADRKSFRWYEVRVISHQLKFIFLLINIVNLIVVADLCPCATNF